MSSVKSTLLHEDIFVFPKFKGFLSWKTNWWSSPSIARFTFLWVIYLCGHLPLWAVNSLATGTMYVTCTCSLDPPSFINTHSRSPSVLHPAEFPPWWNEKFGEVHISRGKSLLLSNLWKSPLVFFLFLFSSSVPQSILPFLSVFPLDISSAFVIQVIILSLTNQLPIHQKWVGPCSNLHWSGILYFILNTIRTIYIKDHNYNALNKRSGLGRRSFHY